MPVEALVGIRQKHGAEPDHQHVRRRDPESPNLHYFSCLALDQGEQRPLGRLGEPRYGEMLDHTLPKLRAKAITFRRRHGQNAAYTADELSWISWRHYEFVVSDKLGRVSDVGHYAWDAGSHRLADHVGE